MKNSHTMEQRVETTFRKATETLGNDWAIATERLEILEHSLRTAIRGCLEGQPDALDTLHTRSLASTDETIKAVCRELEKKLRGKFDMPTIKDRSHHADDRHRRRDHEHFRDHHDDSHALHAFLEDACRHIPIAPDSALAMNPQRISA